MWVGASSYRPRACIALPAPPPGIEAGCGPLSTVWFPTALLPYVLGALWYLIQPGNWATTDATVLRQMTDLLGNIGTAALATYNIGTPISNGDASCNWVRDGIGQFILNM